MKEKIFALCDLEESYAFRMAEYITEKVPMPYVLHLFTKTDELQIFMKKQTAQNTEKNPSVVYPVTLEIH